MSSIKPSTVGKIEHSKSEEKKDVSSPSEKFNKLDLPDICTKSDSNPLVPLCMLSNESLIFSDEPVVVEVKEEIKMREYTGFTIAFKDESVPSLKLKRQESLRRLTPVLEVPKNAEDMKRNDCDEVIEVFSSALIGGETHIRPNPYSKPEEVWTGLEITVKKKDQSKRYVLMTHGLAKWIVQENINLGLASLKSTDSEMTFWEVDTAEIVRDEEKGPYVKLSIDNKNAVYFYPVKASDGELKRFMTENIVISPSVTSSHIDFKAKENLD